MVTKARIELTADDKTRAAFASLESNFKSLQSTASTLSSAFSSVLGGIGVQQMVASVGRAALESEKSINRLSGALKSTGLSAGRDIGQIEALVEALQQSTRFDDEPIREAAATLLRFRDVQREVFDQALQLAPDVAEALGSDLPEAARALGKALEDPGAGLKALRSAGVSLSESQIALAKELRETGDIAGAQRIVLDAVKGSVGGLAAEMNRGLLKQTSAVSNAWGNLLEAIGKTPGAMNLAERELGGLASVLKDIQDQINGTSTRFQGFVAEVLRNAEMVGGPIGTLLGAAGRALTPSQAAGSRSASGRIDYPPGTSPADQAAAARDEQRREEELFAIGERNLAALSNKAKAPKVPAPRALGIESAIRFPDLMTGPDSPAGLAADAALETSKALNKLQEQYRSLIDPLQQYRDQLADVEQLEKANKITLDEATEARWNINQAMDDAAKSSANFVEISKEQFSELTDAINGWSREATQAFVDFAFGAEQSIGDMLESIAKQFAAMELQKSVFGPIFAGLGTVLKGVLPFHSGGIVGMEGGSGRGVPELAFAGAPRFHDGFMPGEYPAILKRGEGVFTPGQMRAMGGAQSVRVEIKNEGQPQRVVSATPSFDPSGMVVSIVTRDLANNGPIAQGMSNTFGVRR